MPIQHKFSVALSKGGTQHAVEVSLPTFAEADEAMRERMWNEGRAGVTIRVQGRLRRAIEGGMRGKALETFAQTAFDEALKGIRGTRSPVVQVVRPKIDATALGLSRAQIDALVAGGAEVYNIPPELAGK